MTRPRLLDLFCGAGGAAMGYHRAGFDVVGVDIAPQPHYPFEFHQSDALDFPLAGFDAIHASPPCQRYTALGTMWNHKGSEHPDLVAPVRARLEESGRPWVIENVPGAPMEYGIMLCGTMFGLGSTRWNRELRRHRWFETSFPMIGPTCQHRLLALGLYGDHARTSRQHGHQSQLNVVDGLEAGREAMQMPWSDWHGIKEAIPPAYTEFVGGWLRLLCEGDHDRVVSDRSGKSVGDLIGAAGVGVGDGGVQVNQDLAGHVCSSGGCASEYAQPASGVKEDAR